MTRAKDELYLITELGNESSFVEEIPLSYFTLHKPAFKDIIDAIPNCYNCKSVIDSKFLFCPFCGKDQYSQPKPLLPLKKSDPNSKNLIERKLLRKEHSEKIEKARKQNKNAYRKWTTKDDETLIEMFNSKKSIGEMSVYFDRTSFAITSRIEKLELAKDNEPPL
jgi:hypothetical protein